MKLIVIKKLIINQSNQHINTQYSYCVHIFTLKVDQKPTQHVTPTGPATRGP